MKLPATLLARVIVLAPYPASSALTVAVTGGPEHPDGDFSATVVGGPMNNANPCYAWPACELRFYTIDESWLPPGQSGYPTNGWTPWYSVTPIYEFETLDAWWDEVRNKTRIGRDNLPGNYGNKPCVVVAAGEAHQMIANTIVSNCARGIVQAPDCKITNPSLTLDFGATAPTGAPVSQTSVTFLCSGDTVRTLSIETNADELIPLGGSAALKAQLDWGAGYGKAGKIQIRGSHNLTLRGRLLGLDGAQPGLFQGSAVVNISYE